SPRLSTRQIGRRMMELFQKRDGAFRQLAREKKEICPPQRLARREKDAAVTREQRGFLRKAVVQMVIGRAYAPRECNRRACCVHIRIYRDNRAPAFAQK